MTSGLLVALPLVSLTGWLSMFGLKHRSLFAGDIAGLVYHLALIPLVQHLPGGPEVKFAGYLWLFMDALVDMVSINHIGEKTVWALRMGVHLFAAIWICGVSYGLGGAAMWIGLPLGLFLAFHAIFLADAKHSKAILGVGVVPIMSAWLIALAFHFLTGTILVS
ncbi:hypothetical protein O9Z70_02075 [Devosia sp. YIM 151766]|uniref:hypothetical protein n=1 Tax=Devosia sp. YIM 151766 TaxID=3017325 RepID=UPI00255CBC51|nr:hypothetical protein [Devosia sp. YIM 151766]WIY53346.1 hypothetical protein O9Z70_02075 [Devosia sp. YIM 151766]